jgi:hypothetical protein
MQPRAEREATERALQKTASSSENGGSSMDLSADSPGSASKPQQPKQLKDIAKPADGKAERTGPERPKVCVLLCLLCLDWLYVLARHRGQEKTLRRFH